MIALMGAFFVTPNSGKDTRKLEEAQGFNFQYFSVLGFSADEAVASGRWAKFVCGRSRCAAAGAIMGNHSDGRLAPPTTPDHPMSLSAFPHRLSSSAPPPFPCPTSSTRVRSDTRSIVHPMSLRLGPIGPVKSQAPIMVILNIKT